MSNFKRKVAIGATMVGLLAAAPAWAQGGAGAGGGGGGGGGAGGGGATTPPPTSCAAITSFANTTGYYSVWAAIWSKFAVSSSCTGIVYWQMTFTNGNTGAVDFVRSGSVYNATTGGTIDEDWAAFSTPYTVALTVTDASGTVLDAQTAVITTKVGKTPGA
jgi:hypothetical protein